MEEYTIVEISDWEEDQTEEMADSGHISDGDIMRLKLEEYETKIEGGQWPGLPFTCKAHDEDDAIERYNQRCCCGDYYKAVGAEFE